MAELVLGPLLRYVSMTEATVWVETDERCEVEVLGRRADTFCVAGHHYALVFVEGLEPGTSEEYEVTLDGRKAWPPEGSDFPPSVLRTFREREQVELAFGSCRVAAPHEPPYTCPKDLDPEHARGFDALHALALSILRADSPAYPDLLFLCGDQVYADEVSPETKDFIASRTDRPPDAPADQVCDFEEYTRLYRESWSDPVIRWLLSTVSTSMVIDDHDMHDDWNISIAWRQKMNRLPWWRERLVGGMTAYWIYQFIGNLSPSELRARPLWREMVKAPGDAHSILRRSMAQDDEKREAERWSYCRDLGSARFVVIDVRTGRRLHQGERQIVDDAEWEWITERATEGDFEHLLFGSSDPYLLAPAFHHLEAWNEHVVDGRWGARAAGLAERMRQALDFDHWGAFGRSFDRMTRLLREVGSGHHGPAPRTIGVLSGDVHHAYLADVAFPKAEGMRSVVYQAVCSPYRNALGPSERRAVRLALKRPVAAAARLLAAAAGVRDPGIRWRLVEGPYFDNQVATLSLDGPSSDLKLHKVPRDEEGVDERLERVFERRLSG